MTREEINQLDCNQLADLIADKVMRWGVWRVCKQGHSQYPGEGWNWLSVGDRDYTAGELAETYPKFPPHRAMWNPNHDLNQAVEAVMTSGLTWKLFRSDGKVNAVHAEVWTADWFKVYCVAAKNGNIAEALCRALLLAITHPTEAGVA